MDYSRLRNNIMDMIQEEQIKLGYRSETVRLYYPLSSLNRCLSARLDAEGMRREMEGFTASVKDQLGEIGISNRGERFCFSIPPQGVEYVHTHREKSAFLEEFIRTVGTHGCTIEEVLRVFSRYSDHVHAEQMENGEFDWLVYFEDGEPDAYRYCLTVVSSSL